MRIDQLTKEVTLTEYEYKKLIMAQEELLAKIKAEIERLKSIEYPCDNSQQATGFFNALDRMTDFLDTLEKSEKPMNQEGLDQEIIKCWQEWISPSNEQSVEGVLPLSEFAFYARHFAQWGAENLKK